MPFSQRSFKMFAAGAAFLGLGGAYILKESYFPSLQHVRPLTDEEQQRLVARFKVEEKVDLTGRYKYVVKKDFRTDIQGRPVTVKKDFLCDGCSGGGIDGIGEAEWLLHDWLYATHRDDAGKEVTHKEADSAFGWGSLRRYYLVRWFGESSFEAGKARFLPARVEEDSIES
jgi:hypothetical protein